MLPFSSKRTSPNLRPVPPLLRPKQAPEQTSPGGQQTTAIIWEASARKSSNTVNMLDPCCKIRAVQWSVYLPSAAACSKPGRPVHGLARLAGLAHALSRTLSLMHLVLVLCRYNKNYTRSFFVVVTVLVLFKNARRASAALHRLRAVLCRH